jgi:hypothetical protein
MDVLRKIRGWTKSLSQLLPSDTRKCRAVMRAA